MNYYELMLAGFNGATSDTDNLIIWIRSDLGTAQLQAHLQQVGLFPAHVVECEHLGFDADSAADFELPLQTDALVRHVAELLEDSVTVSIEAQICGPVGRVLSPVAASIILDGVEPLPRAAEFMAQWRAAVGLQVTRLEAEPEDPASGLRVRLGPVNVSYGALALVASVGTTTLSAPVDDNPSLLRALLNGCGEQQVARLTYQAMKCRNAPVLRAFHKAGIQLQVPALSPQAEPGRYSYDMRNFGSADDVLYMESLLRELSLTASSTSPAVDRRPRL